jgi:hypothetical protein
VRDALAVTNGEAMMAASAKTFSMAVESLKELDADMEIA